MTRTHETRGSVSKLRSRNWMMIVNWSRQRVVSKNQNYERDLVGGASESGQLTSPPVQQVDDMNHVLTVLMLQLGVADVYKPPRSLAKTRPFNQIC